MRVPSSQGGPVQRPKIETAALASPGGDRQAGEPPAELVRLLAEWLDTNENAARTVLTRLGVNR